MEKRANSRLYGHWFAVHTVTATADHTSVIEDASGGCGFFFLWRRLLFTLPVHH